MRSSLKDITSVSQQMWGLLESGKCDNKATLHDGTLIIPAGVSDKNFDLRRGRRPARTIINMDKPSTINLHVNDVPHPSATSISVSIQKYTDATEITHLSDPLGSLSFHHNRH